ncbi:MAG: alpha/beta hydrolase [Pseudomonadota bacterium]
MTKHPVKTPARRLFAVFSASLSLALAGCGGSSGGDSAPPPTGGGNPPPSGERYVDTVFTGFVETQAVQYGAGEREQTLEPLFMDIYTPADDAETDRPVVLLAFGGAFVSGVRSDLRDLAIDFALRGYVAATIDYRLLQTQPADADAATIALLQPLHDLKAAVRFFREDAATTDTYGTDGEFVFAAGVSAGAVLALTSGVLDEADPLSPGVEAWLATKGGLDGNSSANAGLYSSEVQGVLSVSGAIGDLIWVDDKTVPIYAAHEEFDPVVPCGTGTADLGGFPIVAVGACEVIPAANAAGIQTEFFFVAGATTHVGFSLADVTTILDGGAALFASLLP